MVKSILITLRTLFIAACLTVLTQVGGILYLLCKPLGIYISRKCSGWQGFFIRMAMYLGIYLLISVSLIPLLALRYDRVPLPRFASADTHIKPARHFYWIANRHYVRKALYEDIIFVSNKMHTKYPATKLYYLDANFPLLPYFPLLPHKSHNDGRRLDIAFVYQDAAGKRINAAPGLLGYGHCEIPKAGEVDYPAQCRQKGYHWYSAWYQLTKHLRKDRFIFDEEANRYLLQLITKENSVRKVFIEPHLKTRLRLQDEDKVRFHGCGAVRHDDHIHMEL